MHFFQSTSTFHKYFPELVLAATHESISVEPRENENILCPASLISHLASEILQFTHSTRTATIGYSIKLNSTSNEISSQSASTSVEIARLGASNEDINEAEQDETSCNLRQVPDAAGSTKGRSSWSDMHKFLLAGAVSTVISRTCVAPLERIKLECIVQGSTNTWLNVIQWIWVSEGLRGFWKGNTLNLFRMVPFKSINFICYDMYLDRLMSASEKNEITNHDRLIGGGISGVVATVLCLPLDTIRTRLIAPGGEAFGGVAGCFFHMIRNEGFLSLYKGLTPALISMGPASAVFYTIYDILKSSYLSQKKRAGDDGSSELGVARTLIYGAVAGACAETVIYPLEVIRRQLQLQQSTNLGLTSAFVKLMERDGVRSLYAGLLPSTLQVLPSASLSYLFYEMMKSVLKIS